MNSFKTELINIKRSAPNKKIQKSQLYNKHHADSDLRSRIQTCTLILNINFKVNVIIADNEMFKTSNT